MSDELARVGAAVRARTSALGLNIGDVPKRGGPSASTVSRLINGKGHMPDTATLGKLEKALDWAPGSIASVLAGRNPTALEDKGIRQGSDQELLEQLLDRLAGYHSSDSLDSCLGAVAREVQAYPEGETARRVALLLTPSVLVNRLMETPQGQESVLAMANSLASPGAYGLAARQEDAPLASELERARQDRDAEG